MESVQDVCHNDPQRFHKDAHGVRKGPQVIDKIPQGIHMDP